MKKVVYAPLHHSRSQVLQAYGRNTTVSSGAPQQHQVLLQLIERYEPQAAVDQVTLMLAVRTAV